MNAWHRYRDIVTAVDLLEIGACYEGVAEAVAKHGLAVESRRAIHLARHKHRSVRGLILNAIHGDVCGCEDAYGYGDGDGDGYGYGCGCKNAYGYGYGYGYGNGDGDGHGYGIGTDRDNADGR